MKVPEVYLIEVEHSPGNLARVLHVVGDAGLVVEHLESVRRSPTHTTWELSLELDEGGEDPIADRIEATGVAHVLGRSDRVFDRHIGGKIELAPRIDISTPQVLRDVYTPGVARVCLAIRDNPELAWEYTNIPKTVAIVTNGTAILGLGDIGPLAGMPVMEGKAALFHRLAGLSGIPILIDDHDPQKIIDTVLAIAPTFGAIQLEDIGAPECFEIEAALIERAGRPVLHDDQHGTAVVALAAALSATRAVGRELGACTVGQIGLGAAGIGIARLLSGYGVGALVGTDLDQDAVARFESYGGRSTDLAGVMAQADVVIATTGVPGLIQPEMVRAGQLILALSNPEPEIEPSVARARGASFAADGKSVNNVLGFPGLFRGALEARAPRFTTEMLVAAARTLSALTAKGHLVPDALDRAVHDAVAAAVRATAESAPRTETRDAA